MLLAGEPVKLEHRPGLENVWRVTETLFSGSVPEGAAAFAGLKELGIRTIVSVDGMRPDVELARQYGMEYVHIPLPYSGIDEAARQQLARVMRDRPGPVFVHCHHGRHRGPAAAAVCGLFGQQLSREAALDYLKLAGTGENYQGLWQAVRNWEPLPPGTPLPELHSAVDPGSVAEAMVRMDAAWGGLQQWGKAESAAGEAERTAARLLTEEVRELLRRPDLNWSPELRAEFLQFQQQTVALEEDLRGGDPALAKERLKILGRSCQSCHRDYRDNSPVQAPAAEQ